MEHQNKRSLPVCRVRNIRDRSTTKVVFHELPVSVFPTVQSPLKAKPVYPASASTPSIGANSLGHVSGLAPVSISSSSWPDICAGTAGASGRTWPRIQSSHENVTVTILPSSPRPFPAVWCPRIPRSRSGCHALACDKCEQGFATPAGVSRFVNGISPDLQALPIVCCHGLPCFSLGFLRRELGKFLLYVLPCLPPFHQILQSFANRLFVCPYLLGTVTVSESEGLVLDRLEVNGDAKWCTQFIVPGVSFPNAGGRVVYTI